jgi:hypothetical protein
MALLIFLYIFDFVRKFSTKKGKLPKKLKRMIHRGRFAAMREGGSLSPAIPTILFNSAITGFNDGGIAVSSVFTVWFS